MWFAAAAAAVAFVFAVATSALFLFSCDCCYWIVVFFCGVDFILQLFFISQRQRNFSEIN